MKRLQGRGGRKEEKNRVQRMHSSKAQADFNLQTHSVAGTGFPKVTQQAGPREASKAS